MEATGIRRSIGVAALGCAAALLLSGCVPTAPRPTAAPDAGPTELTIEEAADRYLDIVCMPNVRGAALEDAIRDGYQEYADGGAPDPAPVTEAATAYADAVALAIEVLDHDGVVWPDRAAKWLPHISSGYDKQLTGAQEVAAAATYEEAYSVEWPSRTPEEEEAGAAIREALEIREDAVASCDGRETALEELHASLDDA